ncbi:MAG TPA: PBP1A family penicillin-binding protein [Afifellaceae bacterium]|nr:PBP1A family penicillin-binding protein [Afifellaceae bacterium]
MRDPFKTRKKKRRLFRALELDAFIDSNLHEGGQTLAHAYESVVIFFRRFSFTGYRKLLGELASEGFTLGVAGMLVLLAFGVPAFETIGKDWLAQTEYSVTFLDRYGNEIGKRGILLNDAVDLEDLPDHLIKAVLATEDRRFFEHFGIDVLGTIRAIVENARAGGVVQGGSSITQQLAKNLFLSNERTLQRKIKEAYLALWLEANLSKREILKLYLDRAYMGGGTFGVAAAADFFFGKPPTDLTLAESAMLAGLFKAPTRYAPHINLPAARARANEVLTNMVQAGLMTEGQVVAARRAPATPIERGTVASPDYFLDWAFEEVKRRVGGGNKVLIARTTIDMRLQEAAEAAVESSLRESGDVYNVSQAALVSMEPDGTVRAMVGGRDYGQSTFNRAVNARRQPGSSFKPYVYATALENGYTPESIVVDAPVRIGNWSPKNYSRNYRGRITLKTALTRSINTIPVRLSIAIGRQPIADMAKRLGVETPLIVTRALPLGPSEVTVMDMATGYSAFANGGFRAQPHGILNIRTSSGEVLYDRIANPPTLKRALEPSVVNGMVEMLHNVTVAGTGRRAQIPGINAAGKTGTTQAYRDAWFVGFTGNYSTAVWFGNDNFRSTRRLTGGRLPAETWQKYMQVAHLYTEIKPLPGLEPPPDAAEQIAEAQDSSLENSDEAAIGARRLSPVTSRVLKSLEDRLSSMKTVSSDISRDKTASLAPKSAND